MVTPETFDSHIKFLTRNYNIISLSDLCDIMKEEKSFPERSMVITFDDGWRDNYEYAFPILKKYNAPATIFLSTAYIASNKIFWPESLINFFTSDEEMNIQGMENSTPPLPSHLLDIARRLNKIGGKRCIDHVVELIERIKELSPSERNNLLKTLIGLESDNGVEVIEDRVFLNWNEIKEMNAHNIDFGSHCVSHEILTRIETNDQIYELTESYNILKEKIPKPLNCLAYPNGDFNEKIKELTQKAGYKCAVTTKAGQVSGNERDLFALARINIHNKFSQGFFGSFSKARFSCHIHGLF